jgi:hypothetical protein
LFGIQAPYFVEIFFDAFLARWFLVLAFRLLFCGFRVLGA